MIGEALKLHRSNTTLRSSNAGTRWHSDGLGRCLWHSLSGHASQSESMRHVITKKIDMQAKVGCLQALVA